MRFQPGDRVQLTSKAAEYMPRWRGVAATVLCIRDIGERIQDVYLRSDDTRLPSCWFMSTSIEPVPHSRLWSEQNAATHLIVRE